MSKLCVKISYDDRTRSIYAPNKTVSFDQLKELAVERFKPSGVFTIIYEGDDGHGKAIECDEDLAGAIKTAAQPSPNQDDRLVLRLHLVNFPASAYKRETVSSSESQVQAAKGLAQPIPRAAMPSTLLQPNPDKGLANSFPSDQPEILEQMRAMMETIQTGMARFKPVLDRDSATPQPPTGTSTPPVANNDKPGVIKRRLNEYCQRLADDAAVITSMLSSMGVEGTSSTQEANLPRVICNGCKTIVSNVRYRCTNCQDFDFCGKCKISPEAGQQHPSDHIFEEITLPKSRKSKEDGPFLTRDQNRASINQLVHTGIRCNYCNCHITGIRYKCGSCPDFDLCSNCEATKTDDHDPDHIFLKIRRVLPFPVNTRPLLPPICTFPSITSTLKPPKNNSRSSANTPPIRSAHATDRFEPPLPNSDGKLLRDLTQKGGLKVTAGEQFTKHWILKRLNPKAWPKGITLKHIKGAQMSVCGNVQLVQQRDSDELTVSIDMQAPKALGDALSFWKLKSPDGREFSDMLPCLVTVIPTSAPSAGSPLEPKGSLFNSGDLAAPMASNEDEVDEVETSIRSPEDQIPLFSQNNAGATTTLLGGIRHHSDLDDTSPIGTAVENFAYEPSDDESCSVLSQQSSRDGFIVVDEDEDNDSESWESQSTTSNFSSVSSVSCSSCSTVR